MLEGMSVRETFATFKEVFDIDMPHKLTNKNDNGVIKYAVERQLWLFDAVYKIVSLGCPVVKISLDE